MYKSPGMIAGRLFSSSYVKFVVYSLDYSLKQGSVLVHVVFWMCMFFYVGLLTSVEGEVQVQKAPRRDRALG